MRPDELLTSGGEMVAPAPHAGSTPPADDPEVALITEYLAGALAPNAARAVEARLRDDAGFTERVGVIVAAWDAWPTGRDFSLPEGELAEEAQRFRVAAEQLVRRQEESARGEARAHSPHAPQEHPRVHDRDAAGGDGFRQMQRRLRRWQLAAGFVGAVALPAAVGGAVWVTQRMTAPVLHPETHRVGAAPGGSVPVRLPHDALAVVQDGGRLTWTDSADANGIRELYLEGGAQFEMQRVPVGHYVVVTPSARVIVTGAAFEVTTVDPAVTTVAVREGTVVLESRGGRPAPLLPLGAGERGQALWRQSPLRLP